MAKFNIKAEKVDNSHPLIKIAIRKWLLCQVDAGTMLDVYGGGGLMFDRVWRFSGAKYENTDGDALKWLGSKNALHYDLYDIDPYASPFEAIEIVCSKNERPKIGVVCTDGMLRRVAMMRTQFPEFICERCEWQKRDLSLMAAVYNQYPSFLRFVLSRIICGMNIDKLVVKYGKGTWRQATVYFAAVLSSPGGP